jgi:hypothetical protein
MGIEPNSTDIIQFFEYFIRLEKYPATYNYIELFDRLWLVLIPKFITRFIEK